MLKPTGVILMCLVTLPAFSQTTSGSNTGTITATGTQGSPDGASPQQLTPIKSTALIGIAGVKENADGTLTIEGGKLCFAHSGDKSEIAAATMEDVITGDDSQRVIRGTLGTLSMFGPYGSGRVVSLFRSKLDSLTIQYRDRDGGLHGVVFTMPVGKAEAVKKELIAQGAHTSVPTPADQRANSSNHVTVEEKP